MKKNKKWIQIVILSIVVIIGGYTMANGLFVEKDELPQEGDLAPDFSLSDLNGEIISLSDFRGKTVMVNFWGTFCEPCVDEMPLFQTYYDNLKDQDFVVLGVNLDEPQVTAQSFVREYKITFPIALDKNVVRKQYGVTHYPTTFFIDRNGMIEKKFVGPMEEKDLDPILAGMLTTNE